MENITDYYYLHFSIYSFWHYKNYHNSAVLAKSIPGTR